MVVSIHRNSSQHFECDRTHSCIMTIHGNLAETSESKHKPFKRKDSERAFVHTTTPGNKARNRAKEPLEALRQTIWSHVVASFALKLCRQRRQSPRQDFQYKRIASTAQDFVIVNGAENVGAGQLGVWAVRPGIKGCMVESFR